MTEKKLDVYRDWLKIQATNRPLNYYQLLKLKPFEDNVEEIRDHYRKLNAYIRKFATGDYIEESQNLLNELAKAMLCLTDHERKVDYDYRLGRKKEGSAEEQEGPRSFEDILLQNGILSPEQIKKAKSYADAVGLDLQMAILQQRMAEPEKVMLAFAESEGLPFINLDDVPVDEYYAPQIEPNTARQHSFVPVMADMGRLIIASPAPVSLDVEEELRMTFDMPVRCAICTPAQVNAAIAKYYPRDAVRQIVTKSNAGKKATKKTNDENEEGQATKKRSKSSAPLTPADKKRRLLATIMGFNFAFMGGAFFRYFTLRNARISEMLIPGIIAGVVVAGIVFFVTSRHLDDEDEDE